MFQALEKEDNDSMLILTNSSNNIDGEDKSRNFNNFIGTFLDWAFNDKINAGNAQACENINHY